jgi:alpha-L-fucosidase 2
MDPDFTLHYTSPSPKWPNNLPIGNGKLGAMVPGFVHREHWYLNEDSVWYGGPTDRNPPHALAQLLALRSLVSSGRLSEAEKLVDIAFVGTPESQRHYEPLGQVNLDFAHPQEEVVGYQRYLDIRQALSGVKYEMSGVRCEREVFASYPDNVIAARLASEGGRLTFNLRLWRGGTGFDSNIYMDSIRAVDGCLALKAQTGGNGVGLCLVATVMVEGGSFEGQHWAQEEMLIMQCRGS